MNVVLLAVCALVGAAFLWRQYVAGAEAKAFRQAGAAVKFLVTIVALVPILMLLVSLWNVVTPFSYRVMVESFDNYRTPQLPRQTVQVPPQGKNVGGPLRWSDGATVALRKRVLTEKPNLGNYFVGFVPPGSQVDLEIGLQNAEGSREYYLVNQATLGGNANLATLRQGAAKKDSGSQSSVFVLESLQRTLCQTGKMRNHSGMSHDSPSVAEYYIQSTANQTTPLMIKRSEPDDTFQYEVKVGTEKVSVTIPHKNWKWLWVASVDHPAWQSSLDGQPVPAEGAPLGSYQNFQAIMANVSDENRVLKKPLLYQPGELTTSKIDLFLNVPEGAEQIGRISPATVIVGIQL